MTALQNSFSDQEGRNAGREPEGCPPLKIPAFLPSSFPALLFVFLLASETRADLTVASAISMGDALEEISKAYTSATGGKIRHTFSGTNVLARQIEEGAPIDVFVSADAATMAGLVAKGLIDKETVRVIATNELVVVVPTGAGKKPVVKSARSLMAIDRIAVADPGAVPAGIYARKWLTAEGVWEAVSPKIIRVQNVRAALIAAETGNASAAIVYRSDAAASRKVTVVFVADPEKTGLIGYSAAAVKSSEKKAEAQRFIGFLEGETARGILSEHGFGKP